MADSLGYAGPPSFWDDSNTDKFGVRRGIARMATATLAKVVNGPYDANGNAIAQGSPVPIGYVDVQPLVNQVDGKGNAVPHGTVFHCSYYRLEGGVNAVIVDPALGSIGKFVSADRDTSVVKATNDVSNPGSLRRNSKADGTFFPETQGPLNGTSLTNPTNYVTFPANGIIWRDKSNNSFLSVSDTNINPPTVATNPTQWCGFTANGFEVHDKNGNSIVMNAAGVTITDKNNNTVVMSSGGVEITSLGGGGSLVFNGTHTHEHSGVTTGSGNTGAPTSTTW